MKVVSSRNPSLHATFRHALVANLTPEGGLWIPSEFQPLPDMDAMWQLPFPELAATWLVHLLGDEFDHEDLRTVALDAFNFPLPVREIAEKTYALELFHGPSLAFKDFGARLLARLLALHDRGEQATTPRMILTATSGDTGAAVAHAFWKLPGVRVVVLYPNGRVSDMQERQFATLGDNVQAWAVDGSFDDCQALAKSAFADAALSEQLRLTSANSINLARIVAQLLYYFGAMAALRQQGVLDAPLISVPSGNFGNLCAGLYARAWGLPVRQFVAATNANRTVPDYLESGRYQPRPSVPTLSNAMDVGAPSNWERIAALFGRDLYTMHGALRWGSASDEETRREIKRLFDLGWVADPHAAVASTVLQRVRRPGDVGLFLATAHPAKFPDAVAEVTGQPLVLPPSLAELAGRPLDRVCVPADWSTVRARLLA